MANNFFGAIALIGGAAGALDAIDGAGLADLDAAFVQVGGQVSFYTLDATSAAAENSPEVISPDTNAGDKRWILQDVHSGFNLQVGDLLMDGDVVIKHQTGGTTTNCYTAYHRSGTLEWTVGMNRVGTKWQLYSGVFASGTPAISITETDVITFGNKIIVPQTDEAASPTIAFGDGDTGFYERLDNQLALAVGGNYRLRFDTAKVTSATGLGFSLLYAAGGATVPVHTFNTDEDTGVGRAAADALSLIAGGVEGLRTTNAAGVITNKNSDNIELSNTAEGNVGSISERTVREVHTLTLGASSVTTTITIPTGAMLLGVSFNVNDTVADDAGDDTWSAAFSGGSTATLATAAAAAIDTKVNTLIVPEIASGATEITFTPQGGDFTGGIIEVVAYYKSLTSLGDV